MLARGWSASAGRAPLYTATAAAKFSIQAQALNPSRRTQTRFIKPIAVHPSSSGLDSDGSRNGGITSSDLVEREYADLNLKDLYGEGLVKVGHVRIRQHVNPLSSSFSVPVEVPDWDDVFNDCKLPLMVDIGSGIDIWASFGGRVLLQSDVLKVAMEMRDRLDLRADVLKHIDAIDDSISCDEDGWLRHNPIGIRTDREILAELEGATIYRRMYQKL